ncbi:cobalamin B12-binding domain-containing protein [Alkalihalobacillus macyae]|uniref:cobalamin B12-binding domain-containing protein n=1 Tax=Guptibacillus hwajinpoensis TaxID=208199 RepID=UPI00273CCE02|nr:cobalamin B12-binding domain-containing protein [Alkalihalobacillus macyae]MDP4553249.1 cobalamin B12-binding domain-containing protein [Alkalihalobacillus macyae]
MTIDIQHLTNDFLEGDQDRAWDRITEQKILMEDSHLTYEALTKAMQRVGKLWEENEISVADEHLATTTCDYVLSRYAYTRKLTSKNTNGPRALFLCIEQEQHYLGLKMISLLFQEYGWQTKLFGANLPLEHVIDTVEKWDASVVGISVSIMSHVERLNHYVTELEGLEKTPEVIVGGRLAAQIDLSKYCSNETIVVPNLDQVRLWLENRKGGEGHV